MLRYNIYLNWCHSGTLPYYFENTGILQYADNKGMARYFNIYVQHHNLEKIYQWYLVAKTHSRLLVYWTVNTCLLFIICHRLSHLCLCIRDWVNHGLFLEYCAIYRSTVVFWLYCGFFFTCLGTLRSTLSYQTLLADCTSLFTLLKNVQIFEKHNALFT